MLATIHIHIRVHGQGNGLVGLNGIVVVDVPGSTEDRSGMHASLRGRYFRKALGIDLCAVFVSKLKRMFYKFFLFSTEARHFDSCNLSSAKTTFPKI